MEVKSSEKSFRPEQLQAICDRLIQYDPQIVEIIQFGSSVYAPRYARDLDMLVFTKARKRIGYTNVVDELDLSHDVDVVVYPMNRKLTKSLAIGVLGAHRVLHGSGAYLRGAVDMDNPTYEEAWATLETAETYLRVADETENKWTKDRHIRDAFNALFHASRIASMTYLSLEEGGWGKVKRGLSRSYRAEFEEHIDVLHVKYFYDGDYPKGNVGEEFRHWAEKVKDYVERLEEATRIDEAR